MKLADHLAQAGMKPIDFARLIDVRPSTIGRLLKGQRGCSIDLALKIEEATGRKVLVADLMRERRRRKMPSVEEGVLA